MGPVSMSVDRRHIDLRAQRGLRHRNRNSYINIIARPRKHRVRPRLDNQKQVPRRPAVRPGVPLPRQSNPLPIPSPRFNPKIQRLPLHHHAFAIARRARILHLARPAAPRALDIELHPPAHLRHLSGPMALRALDASTRGRLALARRAYLLPLDLQPRHATPHRRPEIHAHLILKIGPRLRPTSGLPPAMEHPAKNILEASSKTPTRLLLLPTTLKIRKIEPAKVERNLLPCTPARLRRIATMPTPAISTPRRSLRRRRIDAVRVEPKLVVDLPLLVVAQNIVGLRDLLELLLRLLVPRIHVRVILARSLAKRLANLIRGRRLLYT